MGLGAQLTIWPDALFHGLARRGFFVIRYDNRDTGLSTDFGSWGVPNIAEALQKANQASGGSVVELAETEYMVRSRGFLRTLDDFRAIPDAVSGATPVLLRDVALVQVGPEMRRGIAEWLNGNGVTRSATILSSLPVYSAMSSRRASATPRTTSIVR